MAQYYKIRLEWNEGKWDKTQKGAYTNLQQAIDNCTSDLIDEGYKVYSPTGEIVYPIPKNEDHEIVKMMVNDGINTDVDYWNNLLYDDTTDTSKITDVIIQYSNKICKSYEAKPRVSITNLNGISVYKIPVELFKVQYFDDRKINSNEKSYFNGGYFGNYSENGIKFTLPSGNLVADINESEFPDIVQYYLRERKIQNGKLYFSASKNSSSQFRDKYVTTLIIKDGIASIDRLNEIETLSPDYAISGYPILINGNYANASEEGWDTSVLRPTYHGFLALNGNPNIGSNYIYYFSMKTKTKNVEEIINAVKSYNFTNIIKLDGGGSAYFKYNNWEVMNTLENRRINNICVIKDN